MQHQMSKNLCPFLNTSQHMEKSCKLFPGLKLYRVLKLLVEVPYMGTSRRHWKKFWAFALIFAFYPCYSTHVFQVPYFHKFTIFPSLLQNFTTAFLHPIHKITAPPIYTLLMFTVFGFVDYTHIWNNRKLKKQNHLWSGFFFFVLRATLLRAPPHTAVHV